MNTEHMMRTTRWKVMGLAALAAFAMLLAAPSRAGSEEQFGPESLAAISFVQFQSTDLTSPPAMSSRHSNRARVVRFFERNL